jgi:hypothetical protein
VRNTGNGINETFTVSFTVNKENRTTPPGITVTGGTPGSNIIYTLTASNPAESTYDVYFKAEDNNPPGGTSDSDFNTATWTKVSGVVAGTGKTISDAGFIEGATYTLTAVARNANYYDSAAAKAVVGYTDVIDMADTAPAAVGIGWTYANSVYTVQSGADVTVTGTNSGSTRRVAVFTNATAAITLDSATIGVSGTVNATALALGNGAVVTLTLVGDSSLSSGSNCPGIWTTGATLTITSSSDGSVAATGGSSGAGIGGEYGRAGGSVTIQGSAQVTATGGGNGAGIGGGYQGNGGSVTIQGGAQVTATAGQSAAGIGGGDGGSVGELTITGNSRVNATGSGDGAGIGGGNFGNGGIVTIAGNAQVTATGGRYSAGIGGGGGAFNANRGGEVTIKDNAQVTATSDDGAGIGGGNDGPGGALTITGGTVTASSNKRAFGGGGNSSSHGTLSIDPQGSFSGFNWASGDAAPGSSNGSGSGQTAWADFGSRWVKIECTEQ